MVVAVVDDPLPYERRVVSFPYTLSYFQVVV
jgi:hypothetical protein